MQSANRLRSLLQNSISLRSFADSAASKSGEAAVATEGIKNRLLELLKTNAVEKPMTTAEIWTIAEQHSVKSKRHMKQMLQQMKQAGKVKAIQLQQTTGKNKQKQFGFIANPQASS